MGKLSFTVAAVVVAAFTAATSAQTRQRPAPEGSEEGFFRPAADPALSTIRPPTTDREARQSPSIPGAPPPAAVVEAAGDIRKDEEAPMDRVEAGLVIARTEVVTKAPAITSPLDGTAPIVSPLDGTAPIVSPLDGTATVISR